MKNLSQGVSQMLLRAGWVTGRNVSSLVDEWELKLRVWGYDMFPMAREVLNEFGGIVIDQPPPLEPQSGLLPIIFNPTCVLDGGSDSWMTKELFDRLAEQ